MPLLKVNNEIYKTDATSIQSKLEKGVYHLNYDSKQQCYMLLKTNDFELPKKIYGDHSIVNYWLKSWKNTSKNLGILLSGHKGSGKTITAQMFCIKAETAVIIVDKFPENSEHFKHFLTLPEIQGSIIFFDEFEKTFPKIEMQNTILSLMDGVHNTNLIFLLTVNETKLSSFMYNRLGRIKYHKEYLSLDEKTILDVVDDLLVNKENKESLMQVIKKLDAVSMDVLVNIISDMNLFNESAENVAKHLNLKPEERSATVREMFNNETFNVGNYNIAVSDRYDFYRDGSTFYRYLKTLNIDDLNSKLDKAFVTSNISDYSSEIEISKELFEIVEYNKKTIKFKNKFADSHYVVVSFESSKQLLF